MCVNAKRPETWRVLFDQAQVRNSKQICRRISTFCKFFWLNVFFLTSRLQFDKSPEIFTEVDFKCGEVVNVLGRLIFLYGCDGYTQWYYKEIYGIGRWLVIIRLGYTCRVKLLLLLLDMKTIDVEESKPFKQVIKPPPYNEYGSEEDSLRNCAMLVPKPPLLDVRKYLLLDWLVLSSSTFCFHYDGLPKMGLWVFLGRSQIHQNWSSGWKWLPIIKGTLSVNSWCHFHWAMTGSSFTRRMCLLVRLWFREITVYIVEHDVSFLAFLIRLVL